MREPSGGSAIEDGASHNIAQSDASRLWSTLLWIAPWIVRAIVVVWAVLLCWKGVSWAFRAWPMLVQDEINNLGWPTRVSWGALLSLVPHAVYNDRPMGSALERLLFDCFGLNYTPQLICFLAIHFTNCLLAVVLFRKLGLRSLLAFGAIGVYGALRTTAQTATYLAASFDVLCTLFLLGSTLAILSDRRRLWLVSALLYLLALRSKEFGIVIPVMLTALLALRLDKNLSPRRMAVEIGRRLWLHYAILLTFAARYLWLARDMRAKMPAGTPYYMDFSLTAVLKSLQYYTALVFGAETHYAGPVAALTLAMLVYALLRRRGMILFCIGAYVLTLLPVSLLPNIRSPFYVYGPQIFLLLAVVLFLQEILDKAFTRHSFRWWATACLALLMLTAASGLRTRNYFRALIHWSWLVRGLTGTSAASMQKDLAGMGPSAHIYVNSGPEQPWLLSYGDCVYPRLMWHSQSIECTIQKPETELLALYDRDFSEKYFLDYSPDGRMKIRYRSPAFAIPKEPLQPCAAGLIDDQSGEPRFRGPWRALRHFGLSCGGTLTYTTEPGAEVSLAFRGTSIKYLFTRAHTRGTAEVSIDGAPRGIVDQYAPGIEWRSEVTYSGLRPGAHTIKIRSLGSKAAGSVAYDVDVDGFVAGDARASSR